jgi:RNA polymerase subunit RPABC4/transcription elongation factor Spt4
VVAILPIAGIVIYLILRPPETLAQAYERALEEEALLQEIEEKPRCPGCSRAIEPDWIACPYCHTHLRRRCDTCSGLLELNWNLCPYCASEQMAAPLPATETVGVQESSLSLPEYEEETVADGEI